MPALRQPTGQGYAARSGSKDYFGNWRQPKGNGEFNTRHYAPPDGVRHRSGHTLRQSVRPYHTWTDHELSAYERCWPTERLAYAVLLYTGQRGGDAVDMLRPARRASTIDLTQKKTNREMRISIHPDLDRIIRATGKWRLPPRRRDRA